MKTLYLLRHAHTTPASPPQMSDHERILSPKGTEDALAVGAFMETHAMYPDFVLSSSAVRTIQTSRLIFGTLFRKTGVKVESHFDRKLYLASAENLLAEIQTVDDTIQHLMMVAHNPGVTDLATMLNSGTPHPQLEKYIPGTLSVFRGNCNRWAEFSPESAKLDRVFVPPA